MIHSTPIRNGLGAILAIILLGGCASTFNQREVDNKPVPIDRPTIEIAESQLLGVRIHPFDPGEIPKEKDESLGLSKDIRDIEGYYSATQLKNTSQQSGYWGPVRVVPAAFSGGEVVVTGRILDSDGEILKVRWRRDGGAATSAAASASACEAGCRAIVASACRCPSRIVRRSGRLRHAASLTRKRHVMRVCAFGRA